MDEPTDNEELNQYQRQLEMPQWPRFHGNNREVLDDHGEVYHGGVSFRSHLGRPLTRELWADVVLRLRVRHLRVYWPGDVAWADCPNRTAVVRLDGSNNVEDVIYHP